MSRIRLGVTNIYIKSCFALLAVALACATLLFALWPVADPARVLLPRGIRIGLLGGVILYAIGRIAQVVRGARRPEPSSGPAPPRGRDAPCQAGV